MQSFFRSLQTRLQRFTFDRYGNDELSRLLSGAAVVLLLLSLIPGLKFLCLIAIILLLLSSARCLSKNKYARQCERTRYLSARYKLKQKLQLQWDRWRERKTRRYYRCPHCKTVIRITKPARGKKIIVHLMKNITGFSKLRKTGFSFVSFQFRMFR